MPQSFNFKLGPVTVTVDGLPDEVIPGSVNLVIAVHSHYDQGDGQSRADRFLAIATALGGPESFGLKSAEIFGSAISLEAEREPDGPHAELVLFIPPASAKPSVNPTLERLLEAEKAST